MKLSPTQRDTLVEIVNIAFGRAASSLSELTGQRVMLAVPKVYVRPIEDLVEHLGGLIPTHVAAVHQEVVGSLPGDALLVQTEMSGQILSQILSGSQASGNGLDAADREVLNEIGNILLHACVGTLGNTLGIAVKLQPPQVYVEGLPEILARILQKRAEIQFGLVISTRFKLGALEEIPETEVGGYVMMLLSVTSLDKLLEALDGIG